MCFSVDSVENDACGIVTSEFAGICIDGCVDVDVAFVVLAVSADFA